MDLVFCFIVVPFMSVITVLQVCTGSEESTAHEVQSTECPPWFFYNTTSANCECHSSPKTDHFVTCTKREALLRIGYCMTYEEGKGFYAGRCNYYKLGSYNMSGNGNYITLPSNVSELNDYMCGPLHRRGVLCSECAKGYGHSVTSVGYTCSKCTGVWYGVPLYLLIEFVPITIFFFIVLFFRINVTSPPMVAFVLYCQIGVSRYLDITNTLLFDTTPTHKFLTFLITFYGVWNLDFFRYVIPPFCVSPALKPIHIAFLDYISAFYPLCLIAVSWVFIHLYSGKKAEWLRRKFKSCLPKYLTSWNVDVKNTMIDVFATFFLLSYAKLVFACFRTLSYEITINVNNFTAQRILHVTSDTNTGYFSSQHLPFAIFSICIFLFILLPIPLLFALYPIGVCRSLIFKCLCNSRLTAAFNIFVDKFYCCYKDGLDGGRDIRSFVCVHFLLRVIGNFTTVDDIQQNSPFVIAVVLYLVGSLLVALIRPYKKTYMNVTDTLILANLALISLTLNKYTGEGSSIFLKLYELCGGILSAIPLIAITAVIVYKIIKFIQKACCLKPSNQIDRDDVGKSLVTSKSVLLRIVEDEELPYRLLHPDDVGEDMI